MPPKTNKTTTTNKGSGKGAPTGAPTKATGVAAPAGLVLDFTGVKGFEPLPGGAYVARVNVIKEGVSKSGAPKLEIQMTVEQPEEHAGRKLFDNISLQEQAMFKAKQLAQALGIEGNQVTLADLIAQATDAEIGVAVTQREFNGEMRNNVAKYVTAEAATNSIDATMELAG